MTITLANLLLEPQAGGGGAGSERAHCNKCGRFVPLRSVRGQFRADYWSSWEEFTGTCVVHGEVEVNWGGL